MSTILVTDGEQRSALAAVRSLGAAGHGVFTCASRSSTISAASRFCVAHERVPDALQDPDGFLDSLELLISRWRVDTLLPMTEGALNAVLPVRERFADVRIPFPSHEQFYRICDKAAVMDAAKAAGIEVPRQEILSAPTDRERLDGARLRFPLVIKPSRSVVDNGVGRSKTGVIHVGDWKSLCEALDHIPAVSYPLLLQERIVGPGIGIFLLMTEDQPIAAFAHRRLREKPISGGVSVYRESVALDTDLVSRSVALLKAFSWEGVAMVEYKRDASTGTPYIMEINGRFWGSLQLAIDAGVDFPRLLIDGSDLSESKSYRLGVRSRWEWGEVDHLLARIRGSREELSSSYGGPGRWRALLDFILAFGPRSRAEVFRITDPAPFLRETIDWVLRR